MKLELSKEQLELLEFIIEDFEYQDDEEIAVRDMALGVWEADDEDDLIEEITSASGWCIRNIDYEVQLK